MARKTIRQRIALDGGKEIQKELEQLGEKGARAFKLLQEAANQVKGPSSAFMKSLDDAQKKLASVGKKYQEVGNQIGKVGREFSTRITLPIIGAGAAIVKVAGDFEAGLGSIQAVSGATADQLAKVRDLALDLGGTSIFSGREIEAGMEALLKNGIALEEVTNGAIQGVTKLAAATGTDLASAADVASDSMQSFQMKAGAFNGAVDQIVGTLTVSKFGFEDYRLALGQAGGVLGALGTSFDDFNAVLAATSNLFSSGSDAGTSFKTFITRLIPQSNEAAAAIEKFGLKFFDASGKMRSMAEIAEELRTKLGGLSDKDLNQVMKDIFGVDALRTGIGLMRQGAEGIARIKAEIGRGDAEAQATARMKGFNGAIEELSGSLETLAIRIADAGLLEAITNIVKGLTEFVQEMSKTNPQLLKFGTIGAAAAAAIGPLLIGIGLMTTGFGKLVTGVGRAIQGIAFLSQGLLFLAANPVLAAITLIGAGIAIWATRADSATAALAGHEAAVNKVRDAYDQAGRKVANLAAAVRDELLVTNRDALRQLETELGSALENLKQDVFSARQSFDFGPAIQQFIDGKSTVEEFAAAIVKVGKLSPELGEIAAGLLGRDSIKTARELNEKFQESSDYVKLLTGELTDAQFQARQLADAAALVTTANAEASRATAETAKKVGDLNKQITVHSGGADGPTKQVFDLVDGVARAAEQTKTELDGVTKSADQTVKAVNDIASGIVSVPEELKGKTSAAAVLTEGLDEAKQALQTTLADTATAAEETGVSIAAVGESWKASGEAAATAFVTVPEQTRAAVDAVIAEVARVQPAVMAALAGGVADGEKGEEKSALGIAEAISQPFLDARDKIVEAMTAIPPAVTTALTTVQVTAGEIGATTGEMLAAPFETAGTRIAAILERMTSAIQAQFAAMLSSVRSTVSQLQSAVASLEALAARAEAAAAKARAATSNAGGDGLANGGLVGQRLAGGGRVSGPGTGTSDSIRAWLSNGEFVMRTAAVKKYGANFMAALNGLRLPKGFGKKLGFANGGPVDFSGIVSSLTTGMRMRQLMPAFAEGGAVSSGGRPINLTIGGERFQLVAPEDVADKLAKYVGRVGLRKLGKRSSWE